MSVIAARKYEDGHIEIGADTQTFLAGRIDYVNKLYQFSKDFVFGTSGYHWISTAFRAFLEQRLEGVIEPNDLAIFNLMVDFRKYLEETDHSNNSEKSTEQWFIFVIENKLFYVLDTSICEINDYVAIGSGGELATGAMAMGATPYEAVEIACKLNKDCGGEIKNINIKSKNVL